MAYENKTNHNEDIDFDFEDEAFLRAYTQKMLQKTLELTEYVDEQELIMQTMTQTMIVHFYGARFSKCALMNKALEHLIPKFPEIKFCFINAEKCPKMTASLKVSVLPFLGFFKGGYFVDHLVGFEKLGGQDTLEFSDLERFIRNSNISKDL